MPFTFYTVIFSFQQSNLERETRLFSSNLKWIPYETIEIERDVILASQTQADNSATNLGLDNANLMQKNERLPANSLRVL